MNIIGNEAVFRFKKLIKKVTHLKVKKKNFNKLKLALKEDYYVFKGKIN